VCEGWMCDVPSVVCELDVMLENYHPVGTVWLRIFVLCWPQVP
jgi:hypothetical protein